MALVSRKQPLTKRQLNFLQPHILRQRKRKATEESVRVKSLSEGPTGVGVKGRLREVWEEKQMNFSSEEEKVSNSEPIDKQQEGLADVAGDVVKQIEALQSRLEFLKEEKHKLFQQLKTVLHEEDEKKRQKDQEQHQIDLEKTGGHSTVAEFGQADPKLGQPNLGKKRSLPTSPTSVLPGGPRPPPSKQHRGPLLPTPETGTYLRQGGQYCFPPGSIAGTSHQSTPRQPYGPRPHLHAGHRPGVFHEQRFGHPHPEMHMQGPHDSHMVPHPQVATHNVAYNQPPPHAHEMQSQYTGVQIGGYPYTPSPAPYGSIQSPGSGGQTALVPVGQYQQVPQQGYVQAHPHDVHLQGQPHPHELHVHPQHSYAPIQYSHAHESHATHVQVSSHHHEIPPYIPQQSQVLPAQGYSDFSQGVSKYGHVHDPRHQTVVLEHQRKGGSPSSLQSPSYSSKHQRTGGSPSSLQSPSYSSKQENANTHLMSSPSHSPSSGSARDRRHASKK